MRWDKLIPDEPWDQENRSDVELEKQGDRISKDARKQRNEDTDNEPCTMPHPGIGLPVPRTEAALTLKLAKKKPKSKRTKKSLEKL